MKRVLIVDDEEKIIDVIQFELELKDYEVTTATCGNDAIKILHSDEFDLIISDVRMPNGGGIDLLKWIDQNLEKKPEILMMTGFSDVCEEELKKFGAKVIFEKPIDFDLFEKYI